MRQHGHLCGAFIQRTGERPSDAFAVLVSREEDRTLTNLWVLERALAIGQALCDVGVVAGDLVIIVLEHHADLYPSFLGCMVRGFVPSFMAPLTVKQDPAIFRRSMAALFDRIQPKAVITSTASRDHVPVGGHAMALTDDVSSADAGDAVAVAGALLRALPQPGSGTAFLQHSSGTTGLKKGVMLSHRAVLEQIRTYADSIGLVPGDAVASWLPLYHDMGLITSFLLPVVMGGTIISLDALDWVARPRILLDYMERYRTAYAWLPNFAFHHIERAARGTQTWELTAVKAVINCSEPCRTSTFEQFANRFSDMGIDWDKLRVCYAMAENVFAVTQTSPGGSARPGEAAETRAFLSCGKPISGVEIEIHGTDGMPVAAGALGEVCIRSTTLFDGYFLQPDVTAERMRAGWYHTNDLGCIEAGELFVLGRVDDLLIVNGKNLFAHEIEDLLTDIPGLTPGRSLACTDFDARLGAARLLILGDTLSPDADSKAIEGQVRQTVLAQTGIFPGAVHLLPRGFLVKSSSGKIARAESFQKFKQLSA